jgi:hypothetical protein
LALKETSIARKRFCKQISAATDTQATIQELLGTMFSVRSLQSGYKRRELVKWRFSARVEAESNTSTVALQVVGDDEKRTQFLGV